MTAATDPQEAALLFAVRHAAPDDTPRLLYADWLDERHPWSSDPRAGFLRRAVGWPRAGGLPLNPPRDKATEWAAAPGLEVDLGDGDAVALITNNWVADPTDRRYALRRRFPVTWDRGFVGGVYAPYRELFGGPGTRCDQCGGSGRVSSARPGVRLTCGGCGGDGRGTGLSRPLFNAWPLTSVTLEGVGPRRTLKDRLVFANGGRFVYGPEDGWRLPAELFDRLPPGNAGGRDTAAFRQYRSVESAEAALSRAAVNLGRSRVGLPSLWDDEDLP